MMWTRAVIGLFVVGCSSHSTAPEPYTPPAGDRVTEQVDGACPTSPSSLRGTKQPGEACSEGADCAPTCCSCNNGTNRTWLAVHCATNVCAGVTQTCADTANPAELCSVQ